MVKSTGCSFRRPGLDSQHPYRGFYSFVTLVPGVTDTCLILTSGDTAGMWRVCTGECGCRQKLAVLELDSQAE